MRPVRLLTRLLYALGGISINDVLNPDPGSPVSEPDVDRLAEAFLGLRSEFISPDGRKVDYQGLRDSPAYHAYRKQTAALRRFDPEALTSVAEKKAFWINLYNGLILDGVLQSGIRQSVQERWNFFMKTAYQIGGLRCSADDIEHGILRANRGHPAIPGPQFGAGDPRRAWALSDLDARVHFALNCGANSCPPIGFYQPKKVEHQLDQAARSFINSDEVGIDKQAREVRVSRIFFWYAHDFGTLHFGLGRRQETLNYIAGFLNDKEQAKFLRSSQLTLVYQGYNWRLNAAQFP